jgi:hypothetical protein
MLSIPNSGYAAKPGLRAYDGTSNEFVIKN